jgi:hypothetical protein
VTQEIESVRSHNKRDFDEYKIAASLPDILLIYGTPRMYAGALPLTNLSTVDLDANRWVMQRFWFTTPTRIHGLLHFQSPAQLFFVGYKCDCCDRIFLVPAIKDSNELANAMRHACHE